MFNNLSLKIGLLFLVFIFIIESFLFFILYTNLVNTRVDEVMESLLARGNTHRDVLEDHFDTSTIDHVGIMESESEFIAIITDENGEIINSSDPVGEELRHIVVHSHHDKIPMKGKVVEDRWEDKKYVATDSPITINGEHKGHVFMFANTSYIKRIIDQLSDQFLVASLITIILTVITIFILSRFITNPLIKMKEATEQLSKGKHHVGLHAERNDELGELARSITKLSKDLKALKKERNEFLASISHELRTPLTYIKGYTDILNRPNLSKDQIDQYATIVQEEAKRLTTLVKDLFQLAKIDENKFPIRRKRVYLCDLLQDIGERKQFALKDKNITLHIDCKEHLIAFIDPERIQQVLINIIDNSQQHSAEDTQITLSAKQKDHYIIITITDEGVGIPKDQLPYVFDRLYRVEKSRSRQGGGTGLGLAIAKEIVESHGGEIEIQSELRKGTTVILKIPWGVKI